MVRDLLTPNELIKLAENFVNKTGLIWMNETTDKIPVQIKGKDNELTSSCIMKITLHVSVPYRWSKVYKVDGGIRTPKALANAFKEWYIELHRLYVFYRLLSDPEVDISEFTKYTLDEVERLNRDTFIVEVKLSRHPIFYEAKLRDHISREHITEELNGITNIDYDNLERKILSIDNIHSDEEDDNEKLVLFDDSPFEELKQRMDIMVNDGLVITSMNHEKKGNNICLHAEIFVPDIHNAIYRKDDTQYTSPDEMVKSFEQCYSAVQSLSASKKFFKQYNYLKDDKRFELFDTVTDKMSRQVSYDFKRVNSIPKDLNYSILKMSTKQLVNQLFVE